jgi:gliding motility-associated-like protein
MVINIKPGSYSSQYKLQALATGFASESQSTVSDLSTDGTNPDANGDAVPDESLVSYISINKLIPVLDAGNIGFTNAASEEKRLQASFCGATSAVAVSQLAAPSGGDETYRFQWQQSADNITYKNIPGAVSSTYTTGTVSENTYLRRSVISGNQLKYSEAVLIRINAISKPVISTAGPLVLSANDSVTIVASTASAYQWSTGATSQSLIVKQAGTYAVTVVDNNGCQAVSDTVTVLPPPPVAVNATYIIGAISNPADISVQVKRTTTGATIRYYASITAAGNINTPALPSVPGTMVYYVSQVVNGLESTKVPVQVTMLTPATISKLEKTVSTKATLQADGSFIIGFTFHTYNLRNELLDSVMIKDDLTKVFPASAKWEVLSVMASGKLVANPFYNGITQTELLSVQSQLPGAQRDSVNLLLRVYPNGFAGDLLNTARQSAVSPYGKFELQSTDPSVVNASGTPVPTRFNIPVVEIFIPDGFSPNRDGKNDTYVIIKPYTVRISLEIFNRWGNPVYRSQDYQNEWDGKGNQSSLFGTDLADGTYYYIVTATDKQTGKTDRFKGFVVLKR